MNSTILGYIIYFAALNGVDHNLVRAVIQVESHGSPSLVGEAGEVGLMQLLPASFPQTPEELAKSKTNLREGIKYMAKMQKQCVHQADMTWIVCYNAGPIGGSHIRYPKKFPYYVLVMREYKRLRDVEDLPVQDGIGVRSGSR